MNKQELKDALLEAHLFRHACKLFDDTKPVSEDDMTFIMGSARLSPTSFGMQGWRIILVTNPELKKRLRPPCWNQAQVETCSHLAIFVTRTRDLEPYSDWVKIRFAERGLPEDRLQGYLQRYATFHEERADALIEKLALNEKGIELEASDDIILKSLLYEWAARQCYIALGNSMTAAALIGIDSCPIEGFEKGPVEEVLSLNTEIEQVVVMAAFGFRKNPAQQKHRLSISELVERK